MNKLSKEKSTLILHMICEGVELQAISRLADCSINTVLALLRDAGQACLDHQETTIRHLPCTNVQCDEIWSYVYAKNKNAKTAKGPRNQYGPIDGIRERAGDAWTWVAMCADTRLIASWKVGSREIETGSAFLKDLEGRLDNRIQLSTDAHLSYPEAVKAAFGDAVDYGQLYKDYNALERYKKKKMQKSKKTQSFSPGGFLQRLVVSGSPEFDAISTSLIERQNGTMRKFISRFVRRTYAFSKKYENHVYAVALYTTYYNFVRIHRTLRVTPAMEAGVTDTLWSMDDVVRLVH